MNPVGRIWSTIRKWLSYWRESEGKPEVQYGDTVTPAVVPEWKVVKKLSLGLCARSRDLRIAILLLRSLIALHGMEGMAEGADADPAAAVRALGLGFIPSLIRMIIWIRPSGSMPSLRWPIQLPLCVSSRTAVLLTCLALARFRCASLNMFRVRCRGQPV